MLMSGSCGAAHRPSPRPCSIAAEVKNRNGMPRWWCSTHGAPAWAPNGSRLPACGGAGGQEPEDEEVLVLDVDRYPGGVGVWGAVDPVFNTGPDPHDLGVHVHARLHTGGHKQIDGTYRLVKLVLDGEQLEVDGRSAGAFVVAAVFGLELKSLHCPWCDSTHADLGEFACTPHRKHQCNRCGRAFFDPANEESISNPLALLPARPRSVPIPSREALAIRQCDFSGLAIWGSNPALLWTSPAPEEEGVHIHAWDHAGHLVVDDTFGSVTIDGHALDPEQVRILMVQKSLAHLDGRVVALRCPTCQESHFDDGADALAPHAEHTCGNCGERFTGRNRFRNVVSNPVVGVLAAIERRDDR